jgi:hypothetical protein
MPGRANERRLQHFECSATRQLGELEDEAVHGSIDFILNIAH